MFTRLIPDRSAMSLGGKHVVKDDMDPTQPRDCEYAHILPCNTLELRSRFHPMSTRARGGGGAGIGLHQLLTQHLEGHALVRARLMCDSCTYSACAADSREFAKGLCRVPHICPRCPIPSLQPMATSTLEWGLTASPGASTLHRERAPLFGTSRANPSSSHILQPFFGDEGASLLPLECNTTVHDVFFWLGNTCHEVQPRCIPSPLSGHAWTDAPQRCDTHGV